MEYIATQKGIKVNQAKVSTLLSMTPPGNITEMQELNGIITAIIHFISRSAEKNIPFFNILK